MREPIACLRIWKPIYVYGAREAFITGINEYYYNIKIDLDDVIDIFKLKIAL